MRVILIRGIGVLAALVLSAFSVHAQQPDRQHGNASARGGSAGLEQTDLLRPYGSRGPAARDLRTYPRETSAAAPAELTRTNYPPPRRNYFPGQRSGQGPNRNYVPPERHCVPGRHAFLHR